MSTAEAETGVRLGLVDYLMWGADYPHTEGTWPRTIKSLRKTYSGIRSEDVAKYVGLNAVHFYGLDRDELAQIASRIGPTVQQISEPYELPSGEFAGWAFRNHGKFS